MHISLQFFHIQIRYRFRKYDVESALERTNNYLQWVSMNGDGSFDISYVNFLAPLSITTLKFQRRKEFGNLRPQEEHESFAKTKRMLKLNAVAVFPDLAPQGKLPRMQPHIYQTRLAQEFICSTHPAHFYSLQVKPSCA